MQYHKKPNENTLCVDAYCIKSIYKDPPQKDTPKHWRVAIPYSTEDVSKGRHLHSRPLCTYLFQSKM